MIAIGVAQIKHSVVCPLLKKLHSRRLIENVSSKKKFRNLLIEGDIVMRIEPVAYRVEI